MNRGVRGCQFRTWQKRACGLPAPAYEDEKDYCLFHYNQIEWLRGIREEARVSKGKRE